MDNPDISKQILECTFQTGPNSCECLQNEGQFEECTNDSTQRNLNYANYSLPEMDTGNARKFDETKHYDLECSRLCKTKNECRAYEIEKSDTDVKCRLFREIDPDIVSRVVTPVDVGKTFEFIPERWIATLNPPPSDGVWSEETKFHTGRGMIYEVQRLVTQYSERVSDGSLVTEDDLKNTMTDDIAFTIRDHANYHKDADMSSPITANRHFYFTEQWADRELNKKYVKLFEFDNQRIVYVYRVNPRYKIDGIEHEVDADVTPAGSCSVTNGVIASGITDDFFDVTDGSTTCQFVNVVKKSNTRFYSATSNMDLSHYKKTETSTLTHNRDEPLIADELEVASKKEPNQMIMYVAVAVIAAIMLIFLVFLRK
jgi:hypothetical protein